MRTILALSLGLCLITGCKPPNSAAPTTPAAALTQTEQTSANTLAQENAEMAQMASDLNQGEKKADSSASTAATASVTVSFSLEGTPQVVDNGDGTVTTSLGLKAFSSTGVVRTLNVATTRKKALTSLLSGFDKRVLTLNVTLPSGRTRKATRTVVINDDKTRTVTTRFEWTGVDGKTRTAEFTRTGDGTGAFTGTGTLTRANGAALAFTYEATVTGDVKVTSTENGVTVSATVGASGGLTSATVTTAGGAPSSLDVETES